MAKNSVIGALRVSLGLDSAQFQSALNNSQKSMANFVNQVKIGMAAVAAAVAGSFALIQSAAGRADEAWKSSQSLGVPIEELGRLRHAAEMSGSSFTALQTAIRRSSQAIDQSVRGMVNESTRAFENIGVSIKNADGSARAMHEVMGEVADAFQRMPDGAQKTAMAVAIFGRSGAELIPMLNQGRAGLKEMGDEAERLGLVFDAKTGRASERFNDNMARLSKAVTGVWNTVLARVVPAFDQLSARIVTASQSGGALEAIAHAIGGAMNVLARGVNAAFDSMHHLVDLLKIFVAIKIVAFTTAVAGGMIALARSIRVMGLAMAFVTSLARVKITTLIVVGAVAAKVTGSFEALTGWVKRLGTAIYESLPEGMRSGLDNLGAKIRGLASDFDEVEGSAEASFETYLRVADEAGKSFVNIGDAMRRMQADGKRVFEQTRTPLERYQQELERLNKLLEAGTITQDTYNRAVAQAQDAFEQATKHVGAGMSLMQQFGNSLRQSLEFNFQGLIDGSRKVREVISDLLNDLARLMMNKAFNVLFGAESGGGGGLFGSSFKGLPAFANGGSFKVGGVGGIDSQVVAFRASPDERVTITKPGQDGRSGGLTVSVPISIDASGADPAAIARLDLSVERLKRDLPGIITQTVRKAQNSNVKLW